LHLWTLTHGEEQINVFFLPSAGKSVATITVLRKDQTLDDPENINTEDKLQLNDLITQKVYVLEDGRKKWDLLIGELNKNKGKKILVFGLYKKEVANLETWLRSSGFSVTAIQGDMTQDKRTRAIEDFKSSIDLSSCRFSEGHSTRKGQSRDTLGQTMLGTTLRIFRNCYLSGFCFEFVQQQETNSCSATK